jgi:general secretion pathway protein F
MQFQYEAFSATGDILIGKIDADSLPSALALLNQRGVRPYRAELATKDNLRNGSWFTFGRPDLEWRAKVVRQLATLLGAGISLDRALSLLVAQTPRKAEREIIAKISKAVDSGQSLSQALKDQSGLFPQDEIGLVKASEQTGSLVPVLEELAALLERRIQLRSKLTSALIYPAFLLTLAPISLFVIATVLVPNLAPLFENSGVAMPFALGTMIWLSTEFHERGLFWLLVSFSICACVIWLSRREVVIAWWEKTLTKLPFVGGLKRKSESARICRTLGSLIRSGAPLQSALQGLVEVASSKTTRDNLKQVRENVSAGHKLADALKVVTSIDSPSLQMIGIGEETNKLDSMLLYVADSEEKALANAIDRCMTLLTPLLTIALGLFVGGIVMSIMKAILSVNDLVAK